MKKGYFPDQKIMDNWNYLLEYKKDIFPYTIEYRRTQYAFCQNLCFNKKHIGCIYIFGLKKYPDGLIHGYVARVYVNPNFRNTGSSFYMMADIIKHFGKCILHISSASPNRIEGLNDNNREEHRKKLYKFYECFGFKRTSTKHTGMIRDL
jgi:hypothetical protein